MFDRRNVVIAVLIGVVVVLAAMLTVERGWLRLEPEPPPKDAVAVIDVVLDRENRRHLDVFFDRPLGLDRVGQTPAADPAAVDPPTGGAWRWQATNVLRFEPTDRFRAATRYRFELRPEAILLEGQTLVGDASFDVLTDQFQVDRIDVHEESVPEGQGVVRLRGTIHFNYPVRTEELAPRIELIDPSSEEPIEVSLETSYQSRAVSWRSADVQKSAEERVLELAIDAELTPADGNVSLPSRFVHPIPLGSRERLVVRSTSVEPGEEESRIHIAFSSPVSPEAVRDRLEIRPPVDYGAARAGNEIVLSGPFRPGDSYALRLSGGLIALDDSTLAEPWSRQVKLADLKPSVDFESQGMFLSASGAHAVAIESVNVPKIEVRIERVYRNNVLYLLETESWLVWNESAGYRTLSRVYGDRVASETLNIEGPRNQTVATPIRLDPHLEASGPGLYRVVVAPARRPYDARQRWVLITDIGLVAKTSREDVLVWASSFASLDPIAGAAITVISTQNQVLAEARTDASGVAHLAGLGPALAEEQIGLIVAESAGDWSFLPVDRTRIDTAGLDVGGATAPRSGYDAYLYGERDLYRPGETVRGAAVLRDSDLSVPPAMPIVLRRRDPQGRQREELRLELDEAGVAEFELPIAAYERTGRHKLELLVGNEVAGEYRYQVEEFVPDRIKVEIDAPEADPIPGQELSYAVESAYLFGPPAAGLAVDTRVRLRPAPFHPSGYEGFSFENREREFDEREILEREGRLDAGGRAAFAVEIPSGLLPPAALDAEVTARVQEQGGRGVTARQLLRVHAYPYYLGLRRAGSEAGYAEPGAPTTFEFVAVAPAGSEVPSGALLAELFHDRWHTVLRRTPRGTYKYESKREPRLVTSVPIEPGSSSGRFEVTPPDYGSYRVVITDARTGTSAQVGFYASGWGFAPWSLENPSRIELDLDKRDYTPGERARVQVRTPFAGRLLLGVERDGVLDWQVHTVEGNTAQLEVPIREGYRPNVYITATLIRSARNLEPGSVGRAYGAVPLDVDRRAHEMQIAIEAPDEMRPGGPLAISVRAQPGARVTVGAVDEGILQLAAQRTPDPFEYFYRKRALGVGAHDIFGLLFPEVALEGATAAGGGVAMAMEMRRQLVRTEGIRRVKPISFWSGVVEADAEGRVGVRFEVPEFQGALRVMAVAHRGADFGSQSGFVRVRDRLVLLPTFPRFLSFGERLLLPVTLRNDTGAAGEFAIGLRATGPVAVEAGAREVPLEDGRETTVYFDLATSEAPGEIELSLQASGNGEETRAHASLGALRPDLPPVTLEAAGSIDTATAELEDPGSESLRPEGRSRSLRLSPFPLVSLYGKLESLVRYPYGCLEQVTSRAFPLIYVGTLARELEPELFEAGDPDAMVAAAIGRLQTAQLPDGGFPLWPGGDAPHLWASLYATHFLVEAERAGHVLPSPLLDPALDFASREAQPRAELSGAARQRAVYALYILARAGRGNLASMDFMREKHGAHLDKSSRALLAAAYASVGHLDVLAELIQGVDDAEEVRRETGGNFRSTVRDRALVLLALLDAVPDDPRIAVLADRLARDAMLEDRWSTQETAFALIALGQLFQRQAERAGYSGAVLVEGDEVARFGAETQVLRDLPPGPIEIRLDPGYEPGSAFYSLHTRGVPTDVSFAPAASGLELERTLERRNGQDGAIEQGDLLELRLRVRSTAGRVENVVISNLLPSGLEVENPRLATTEGERIEAAHLDVRDDRLLVFVDLPDGKWHTWTALLRAVSPGEFRLPPAQAEAMYDPRLRATGERGTLNVAVRE